MICVFGGLKLPVHNNFHILFLKIKKNRYIYIS